MLEVKNLSLHYGDAQALSDVSIEMKRGELIAIIGANGAGKTSLIKALAGIEPVSAGSIYYDGVDISHMPSHKRCNLGLGQVAEGRQIFPSLSVDDNITMGAQISRAKANKKKNRARVLDMFPRLQERLDQAAGTLSGGEQQMLAIARCLMGEPDLIMFDEPSLGLAPAIVQSVMHIIKELNEQGMSVLLVEQNVASSLRLSNHAYVLENGAIALSGTGQDLLHDERVRQAYMGL